MTQPNSRYLFGIACGSYLVFGMFNAGIGPILGELARQTGSSLAAVGAVLTFLFLGSFISQIFAGPLTDRYGQNRILIISMMMIAVGLTGFTNATSLPLMLGLVFLAGLGQGGVDLSANLVVSDAYPAKTTSYLNLLHFFFGLGAFFGPALVGLAITTNLSGRIVHWVISAIFIILALLLIRINRNAVPKVTNKQTSTRQDSTLKIYLSPLLWLIGGLILFYVGIEFGVGSWITQYMGITAGMLDKYGAMVTSGYWGALTIGRLAGSAASRKLSRMQLLYIAILGLVVGTTGLILSREHVILTILFVAVTGLSAGTVYPTSASVMVAAFPRDQGKAVGILAAMGSVGGLALPWMAGVLLENGSPLIYTIFLAGCSLLILMLLVAISRMSKVQNPDPA